MESNNEVIEAPVEETVTETTEEITEETTEEETIEEVGGDNENTESENEDTTSLLSDEVVSGGDSVSDGTSAAGQIINQFTLDGASVHVVQEYTLIGDNAKPISEYSVTEGLLLCILLVVLGQAITRIIGGILNCKSLFKK